MPSQKTFNEQQLQVSATMFLSLCFLCGPMWEISKLTYHRAGCGPVNETEIVTLLFQQLPLSWNLHQWCLMNVHGQEWTQVAADQPDVEPASKGH